uniref:Uncharacterized protein n=1 Tax=Manihot esculenta TaxID=3983 RepID=A0A2C9UKF9_MANES
MGGSGPPRSPDKATLVPVKEMWPVADNLLWLLRLYSSPSTFPSLKCITSRCIKPNPWEMGIFFFNGI